jgi:hypothetical protein
MGGGIFKPEERGHWWSNAGWLGKTKGSGRVGLAARARADWLMATAPAAAAARGRRRGEASRSSWGKRAPALWMDWVYSRKGDRQVRIPRARVGDDVDGLRTLATGFLKKANFGARKFFFHRLSFFVSRRGIV